MEKSFVIGEHLIFTPKTNTLNFMDTDEKALILGENESRLLLCFVLNNDRTLSRNQLIDYVWADRNITVDDSSLTQAISTLRKALGDSTKIPIYIKTVPKIGYEFIEVVKNCGEEKEKPSIEKSVSDHLINGMDMGEMRYTKAIGIAQPSIYHVNNIVQKFMLIISLMLLVLFSTNRR
jgi:DNA-binding winged helix-turn-helix (wHTH) protein